VASSLGLAHRRSGALGANMLGNLFGEDITVCKIQVACNTDRGSKCVLGAISSYVDDVDTEDEESLADFVADVALALMRREDDWISGNIKTINVKSEDDAEDEFSQMSLKERAKIERETINQVAGRDKSDDRAAEGKLEDLGKPTSAVVTMILAMYGKKDMQCKDARSMRKALSSFGSGLSDSLLAAEVMWTPEEPWENMSELDIIEDYPDLIPF